jgi:hypothetical protein
MARKGQRPNLFRDSSAPKRHMDGLSNALEQGMINAGAKAADQSGDENTEVKRMPKYLQVTQKRMEKQGVIDLKPFFARSSKRTPTKSGGWKLVVPIARTRRGMSERGYRDVNRQSIAPNESKTIISRYLYDGRKESAASELNYTPKSNNITKIRQGKKRHTYVAFRTVSDKSPANSWIINRDRVSEDNTSKTMIENVNRLMRWKMKNGWS